jgi:LysR family glycine cleavage system transcriptional activator
MPRPVPLSAIRVFEAAARCGSFKLAASELLVTPGAVSRQIAALEARLKAQLFERANRRISLSEAGRRYFNNIRPALAAIDSASEKIALRSVAQSVRVDTIPTFALHWLIPRLPDFDARHHGIDIALTTCVGPIDRTREFDWAIRRDPRHFRGLRAEKFLIERSLLVASPSMRGGQRLKRPQDLANARIIYIGARPDLWPRWFAAEGLDEDDHASRIKFEQTIFAIQAVLEGLGVAFIPELFVTGLLATGSLVCPFGHKPVVTGAYYLVSSRKRESQAASKFRSWIRETAAMPPSPGSGAEPRRMSYDNRAMRCDREDD